MIYKKNLFHCIPVILTLFFIACSIGNEKLQKPDYDSEEALLSYIASQLSEPRPDIYINPEDGSRDVAPDASIIFYFTHSVCKNCNWTVTIDAAAYNRNSPEIEWSENCFDNDCYPVLIITPKEPYPQAKTVSVATAGFLTGNRLVHFNTASTSFTISE